jgi:hypothetical protein
MPGVTSPITDEVSRAVFAGQVTVSADSEQCWQPSHIVENDRTGPVERLSAGKAAGIAESAHASRPRRVDSVAAVLDHGARRRLDAHALGGVEKQVGRWLAPWSRSRVATFRPGLLTSGVCPPTWLAREEELEMRLQRPDPAGRQYREKLAFDDRGSCGGTSVRSRGLHFQRCQGGCPSGVAASYVPVGARTIAHPVSLGFLGPFGGSPRGPSSRASSMCVTWRRVRLVERPATTVDNCTPYARPSKLGPQRSARQA